MKKGVNFLELLFVVFLTLHFAGVQPFNGWKWYVIAVPLFVELFVRLLKRLWYSYGLDKLLYTAIEEARYDLRFRKEVNRAKKRNGVK